MWKAKGTFKRVVFGRVLGLILPWSPHAPGPWFLSCTPLWEKAGTWSPRISQTAGMSRHLIVAAGAGRRRGRGSAQARQGLKLEEVQAAVCKI